MVCLSKIMNLISGCLFARHIHLFYRSQALMLVREAPPIALHLQCTNAISCTTRLHCGISVKHTLCFECVYPPYLFLPILFFLPISLYLHLSSHSIPTISLSLISTPLMFSFRKEKSCQGYKPNMAKRVKIRLGTYPHHKSG